MLILNKLSFCGLSTHSSRMIYRKTARRVDGIATIASREISALLGRVRWFHYSTIFDEYSRNVHNEETFRPLMASELERSERSGQTYQVILMQLSALDRSPMAMDEGVASTLFKILGRCLRETDYVGWYRERLVVGAVLTALGDNASAKDSRQIEQRIVAALHEYLPAENLSRLTLYRWQPHEFDGQNIGQQFCEGIT